MVRARITQPSGWMDVRNASHVAARAGWSTVGNSGQRRPVAILVSTCAGPGRGRIDIGAMRAVDGDPVRRMHGRRAP